MIARPEHVVESVAAVVASAERLARAGDREEAMALLTSARELDLPDRERYEIGETLLRLSNCQIGWEEYNLHPSWAVDRIPGVRAWDGKACRLLVVMADLGFGDTIMALRHVPELLERVGEVVVAVHDELFNLLRHAPILTGTTVISKTQARNTRWPDDARWERLFSLPGVVGMQAVAPMPGYLSAPTTEPVLAREPGELIIGIAWRSTVRRGFPNRSIPVRHVAKLAALPKARLVCLHRDDDLRRLPQGVTSVGIRNFVETAAVMVQCDLVVTADTVTAHLAPALGVPTLIGLRHWPAWIWGTKHNPTRWYEQAQFVFQGEDESWSPAIEEIKGIVNSLTRPPTVTAEG